MGGNQFFQPFHIVYTLKSNNSENESIQLSKAKFLLFHKSLFFAFIIFIKIFIVLFASFNMQYAIIIASAWKDTVS